MRSIRKAIFEDGFEQSGTIHNLDPNDPEIVYYKAVNARGSGLIDS